MRYFEIILNAAVVGIIIGLTILDIMPVLAAGFGIMMAILFITNK
jgi:hypothetical protein